jgi:SAM-dependent methyltransferase
MAATAPLDWWASYFDSDYRLEHSPAHGAARSRREVARALAVAAPPVGARVLDCPCGHGRHARLLAEAGYRVTGLDYSATLLAEAKRGAGTPGLSFRRGDMRALPSAWSGKFDAVVSLGLSFGFFATTSEDEAAIAGFARVLKPEGVLVLHAPNRDGIASRLVEKDWWETRDGTLLLHEREFDPLSGILTVFRTIRRGQRNNRRAYRLRLYTASEIAAICARNGLIVTEAFDGWRDRPLRRRSGEMLLRAERE